MKRSDIIEKIKKVLCENIQSDGFVYDENDLSEDLLKLVEEACMLPPSTIHPLKGGYGINDVTHVISINGEMVDACRVNKWDDE